MDAFDFFVQMGLMGQPPSSTRATYVKEKQDSNKESAKKK
ncbi:hypothetical protein SMUE_22490 [Enterococcus cecorum]